MSTVFAIVECSVNYENGTSEILRPTYKEISARFASIDHISVINYLKEKYQNIRRVEILDTLYFRSESDYNNYLKSLENVSDR